MKNRSLISKNYTGVKKRTYEHLIEIALKVLEQGKDVSITELSDKGGVSRATAYRYFPTKSDLISAVVEKSLGPIFFWKSDKEKVEDRVNDFLAFAFPQMLKHEGALRAALRLSLQQWATERSKISEQSEKLVRGNRKEILSNLLQPIKEQLPDELYNKVIHSISIIYGSEIFMVLKDIWNFDDEQMITLSQWISKAIINQARRDAEIECNHEKLKVV
ncbi:MULTISPECIES: TetR/AcrR family transcriptional regulator [unclassified Gilliamella]|uniref:TetR/AcrR family transcriptional regulator n=1 Tax=unclassified Gilliamella TaxID=2685620 RepID=UPI000A349007|nr:MULTISPECIES: TetR/AcrR family transcriptional regulator [unclassified Gilliamella]OTQ75507.1 TetR family transcriptional regulator [Gilliamella sp. N-G2]OTQ80687.1 TetR family transcriptional regulator [Gilliamella sp. N-W3]